MTTKEFWDAVHATVNDWEDGDSVSCKFFITDMEGLFEAFEEEDE